MFSPSAYRSILSRAFYGAFILWPLAAPLHAVAPNGLGGTVVLSAAAPSDFATSAGTIRVTPAGNGTNYFIVAGANFPGSNDLDSFEGEGIYGTDSSDSTERNPDRQFTISADTANLASFRLTGLNLKGFLPEDNFYDVKVVGTDLNNQSVSFTVNGSATTTLSGVGPHTISLDGGTTTPIKSFAVSFDLRGDGTSPTNFTLYSFTIQDAEAPVVNTAPAFVGATTTLTVNANTIAADLKPLLHVSDSDASQTLTWSQSSAPAHGTLAFSSATASSGGTDITPGGTITYSPTSAYAGSDSFTVQVSDGTATATRTISVTVNAVAPGAPTIGTATRGNAQASVAFSTPANNGGASITTYTATANPGSATGTNSASPITVSGLTNGTAYTFTVTATNSAGTGNPSAASNSVTPATVPGAPTGVSATAGDTTASVSFTAPASDGGDPITGYTVTSSPGNLTGTGATSPIGITGLTNGVAYTFTVTATNGVGPGSASSASSAVTPRALPAIASATYHAGTGALVVTGTDFTATTGALNDIVANRFTLTGEGGSTYTLTDTPNVEISAATSFTLSLSATDRAAVNLILNKNGTASTGGTTYNLAGATGFVADEAATSDTTGNGVTVSAVPTPAITGATYDAATGVLVVTGSGFVRSSGNANDVDATKLIVYGEGGSLHAPLSTADVEVTSGTAFSVTLSADDKDVFNTILNKNGNTATGGATYSLTAQDNYLRGADATLDLGDTGNTLTVSNVAVPTITAATYDASTGALVVTGTGFLRLDGSNNDIVANRFTLTGEGAATHTLTDTANVDMTSTTAFTLTLSATDRATANLILNKNGTSSTGATTYNLAAAEDWAAGADAAVTVADLTGNGVTVSNVAVPALTGATYDAATGALVVTGTGFSRASGGTNDIVANKFTLTGQGGATHTLTDTANVEVTSGLAFTLSLSTADRTAVNLLLNRNGTESIDSTTYNLAAAEDWAAGAATGVNVADLTGNGVTVSHASPAISSALTASGTYGSVLGTYTIVASNTPTSYSATGLPAGLAIDTANGQITGTPTDTAGSPYNVTIGATNADGSGSATLVLTIAKAPLSLTGVTATGRTYDGTAAVALNSTSANLIGAVNGDSLNFVSASASGTLPDRHVGTNRAVTVSGFSVTGANAAHYTLSQPTGLTATITAKALSVTGLTAQASRVYDATTTATLTGTPVFATAQAPGAGTTADGVPYSVDAVSVGGTPAGAFADRHTGTNKAITVTGLSVSGTGNANYTLTHPTDLVTTITPKPLGLSGLTAIGKVYDGSTTVSLSGTPALLTAQAPGAGTTADGKPYTGDTLSLTGTAAGAFADRHAGSTKPVFLTGLSLADTHAANYSLSSTAVTATISPKALTVSGLTAAATRLYDATTTALLEGTPLFATAQTVGSGSTSDGVPYDVDTIAVGGTPAGTFVDRHVGTGKAITVTGLTSDGTDGANYTVIHPAGLSAAVSAKALTATGLSAADKPYDGTAAATISGTAALLTTQSPGAGTTADGRPYTGDTVSITGSASGTFASTSVGASQTVSLVGLSLTGAQNANYALTAPTTTASITARSLTVTATAGQTKIYGVSDPTFSSTLTSGTLFGGDTLSGALSRVTGENVGSYALTQGTLTAGSNYAIVFVPANFTISPKAITVTATADQTKIYGAGDPTFAYSVTSGGPLLSGDSFTGTLSRATGETVGTYAIGQGTLTAGPNYTVTFVPANFAITRAGLTVTADAKSRAFQTANPPLTYTITGFVNGDSAGTAVTGSATLATTAVLGSAPGSYPITFATNSLAATNYTLSAANGTLTVTPTYHSADTNGDWKISLDELTRVIELYNTTSGTTRTGAYQTASITTEDGYAPSAGSIATPHSADSNEDGLLSLDELTRVIELYNTTSGTTRTGDYHQQNGTEDGYAPGAGSL